MKTLTAYYDLAVGPVSFDVISFLIQARMAQEDAGCDTLQVVIVPHSAGIAGMFRDKTALYDAAEMDWRLWHIVVPACRLAGALPAVVDGWAIAEAMAGDAVWPTDWRRQSLKRAHHHAREIIAAARKGRAIPKLRASEHARRSVAHWMPPGAITVTCRQTYDDARNMTRQKLNHPDAIHIDDTQTALARGYGYAEFDLDLRMAMYERARMNIHPNGGPVHLCWFSDARFIQFDAGRPAADWAAHWEWLGLKEGGQLPWARPDQRLVYGPVDVDEVTKWASATS